MQGRLSALNHLCFRMAKGVMGLWHVFHTTYFGFYPQDLSVAIPSDSYALIP
jgi:hypothetical protein